MEKKCIGKNKTHGLTGFLFIIPSLTGLSAFFIIPFFRGLYYTFTQGIANMRFVGLRNITELFASEPFRLAVKNTAVFMGAGVPPLFFLALALSLLLSRAAYVFERFALLAPLIVPIAAVVTAWRMLLGYVPGIASTPMAVIVLLFLWKNAGYLIVILTSAISILPGEYTEVFRLESNSFFKLCTQVILPLIAPMAFFAAIIAIMNSFKIFREVYVLYGADPPRDIYMLQHFMNNNFFKLNYQRLSAATFLVIGFVVILIGVYMKTRDKMARNGL